MGTSGHGRSLIAAWSALLLLCARPTRAQEAAPRLLAEPTEYTNVIDAFEDDDPFDFDVHLGFQRSVETQEIEREIGGGGGGRGTPRYRRVADSSREASSLVLGLDVGLYHDLMAYVRLPLVLSDTRSLSVPSSGNCGGDPCPELETALRDVPTGGRPLFSPDFSAPTRSGVPAIDLGLAFGITNQYDRPALPTWVVSLESRFAMGDVMKPCTSGNGCDPGISRGTARVMLQSRWSYRFRYLEPHLGVSYAHEWATTADDEFAPLGGLPGYVDAEPPDVFGATVGLSIVPWEERGRFQRFAVDVRAHGAHVSAGRDYSPLFDALGSSSSLHLTTANSDQLVSGSGGGKQVPFTGLTNVAAHEQLGLELALHMQAAQYVRFRLGGGLALSSAYLLTDATQCNTDARASASDPRTGACAPNLWNPLFRPVIDLPGQRFRSGGSMTLDLFASATGQF